MKRAMSVLGILIFFGVVIMGFYAVSNGKVIKRSTQWAVGKLAHLPDDEYDVIVVGSDAEGIAAAIASARSGAKTLLLGKEEGPGGLLTYGMLNTLDMNRNGDVLLTRGIFQEFYNAIGNTESFDVEKAKKIFQEMIDEEKLLEYRKNQTFIAPILDENVIVGVKIKDKDGITYDIKGKRIIDATQDGDVCAAAGVPYYVGMEDINLKGNMAATLVLKVGGVKWSDIEKDLRIYEKETKDKDCGFNRSTAWGFGKWCYDKYTPIYPNMQLRGPNFGLQEDGTILINALQIFDVDGLNEESKLKAIEQGKEEAKNVIEHFRKILPNSFTNAYLVDTADELYIRETRHIKGEYTLLATDVLGNRNFPDKIALSSYPIDIQATAKSNTGYVIGSPKQYSIPLGCVVPKKIDNLFIVSRAASYSSVAAGSARVVPTGMAVGESSGIAAVYTIWKDITPRKLLADKGKIRQLSGILKKQNVYLNEENYGDPNKDVEGYDKIKKLINIGLLSGGYSNNYFFDKSATVSTLCNAMVNTLQRVGKEEYSLASAQRITNYYSNKKLTGGAAARVVAGFLGKYKEPSAVVRQPEWDDAKFEEAKNERINKIETECFAIIKNEGYFSEDFKIDDVLTNRQVYIITVDVMEEYLGRSLNIWDN